MSRSLSVGFRVSAVGFSLGSRVEDVGLGIHGLGFKVQLLLCGPVPPTRLDGTEPIPLPQCVQAWGVGLC